MTTPYEDHQIQTAKEAQAALDRLVSDIMQLIEQADDKLGLVGAQNPDDYREYVQETIDEIFYSTKRRIEEIASECGEYGNY